MVGTDIRFLAATSVLHSQRAATSDNRNSYGK